jgi:hypothetical protein
VRFTFIPNGRFWIILAALFMLLVLPAAALAQDGAVHPSALGIALTPEALLAGLVLFDNRATEYIKRALIANVVGSEQWSGVAVLTASFLIGIAGVLMLPGLHLFGDVAASSISDVFLSGIVVAGLANGVDFVGGVVDGFTDPNKNSHDTGVG